MAVAVLGGRRFAVLALVLLLATACGPDRGLSYVNRCGAEIEFFALTDADDRPLNETTLGDSIRLAAGERRDYSTGSTATLPIEIYSLDLDLVESFDVTDAGGDDVMVIIESGCDVLALNQ